MTHSVYHDKKITQSYTVLSYDCDRQQNIKISSLQKLFQDAADQHCINFGCDYNTLRNKYGVCFVLVKLSINIFHPVKLNESGQIKLPDNMWFIGTANNDDSTFAISDKVYDRAMIVNLDRKSKEFSAPHTEGIKLAVWEWEKLVREAEEEYGVTARNLRRLSELKWISCRL